MKKQISILLCICLILSCGLSGCSAGTTVRNKAGAPVPSARPSLRANYRTLSSAMDRFLALERGTLILVSETTATLPNSPSGMPWGSKETQKTVLEFKKTSDGYQYTEQITPDSENQPLTPGSGPVNTAIFEDQPYSESSSFDILEDMFRTYDNIPDTCILDAAVPKIMENLSGAAVINRQIEKDYSDIMTAKPPYSQIMGSFSYPVNKTYYEEYQFGNVYEICVFTSWYSALGSGILTGCRKYYYGAQTGRALSEQEFLTQMKYSEEDILAAFYEQCLEESDRGDASYTYQDIRDGYYFDGDGDPVFVINLYS